MKLLNQWYAEKEEYLKAKQSENWPKGIAKIYGDDTAYCFYVSIHDIKWDISSFKLDLVTLPDGTHIGEIDNEKDSLLRNNLPEQFLTRYDYDFLVELDGAVSYIENWAKNDGKGNPVRGCLDEVTLFLIEEYAKHYFSGDVTCEYNFDFFFDEEDWHELFFYLISSEFIYNFGYKNAIYVPASSPWHFDQWAKNTPECSSAVSRDDEGVGKWIGVCRKEYMEMPVEEAAKQAGVSVEEWEGYENGNHIPEDKADDVCKVFNWMHIPYNYGERPVKSDCELLGIRFYRTDKTWPKMLENRYGEKLAYAFYVTDNELSMRIEGVVEALFEKPGYATMATKPVSYDEKCFSRLLPKQFMDRYDIEFFKNLEASRELMRAWAIDGTTLHPARRVIDELSLYLIASYNADACKGIPGVGNVLWNWLADVLGDFDLESYYTHPLHGEVTQQNEYHFDHWLENQFWGDLDD